MKRASFTKSFCNFRFQFEKWEMENGNTTPPTPLNYNCFHSFLYQRPINWIEFYFIRN